MYKNGFDPLYDDGKDTNTIYFGRKKVRQDGKTYRKVELLLNEEKYLTTRKGSSKNSVPKDFVILEKDILYESEGGQQKIHCWLVEDSQEKGTTGLHISRRKGEKLYGSQEIVLHDTGILALREFLSKLFTIDTPYKMEIPIQNEEIYKGKIITSDEFQKIIVNNLSNTDLFHKLLSIQKMEQAIVKLGNIINGDFKNETDIQKFLKSNLWMFGNDYVFIVRDGNINPQNILDVVPQNIDSYIDIVEVKLPNKKLFQFDTSHNNYFPNNELTKAIAQTQNYLFELENTENIAAYERKNDCRVLHPIGIVLYGTCDDLTVDEIKYLRILNSSYHNIQIITYQQLLAKAKNTLKFNAGSD